MKGRGGFLNPHYTLLSYGIFFLDSVLAFLIISISWFIQDDRLQMAALIFGIAMIAISLVLRFAKRW